MQAVDTFEEPGPGLAWAVLGTLGGCVAAIVVAGVSAGRAGIPIGAPLLLVAGALGLIPGLIGLVRRRWELSPPELPAALVAFVAVAAVGLWLAWPSLLPLGLSVDAVHHYQLVQWIAEQRSLPATDEEAQMRLGEMTNYPPGLTLLVVAASDALGIPPLRVMYPLVAALGALTAAMVALLAAAVAGRRTALGAAAGIVAVLLLLGHRTYALEAYIDHSYYTMVLGVLLVLLAAGWLILEPGLTAAGALQLGLVLAALLAVYPLWWPIPAALAAGVLLLRPSTSARRPVIPSSFLVFVPSIVFGLVDVPARLGVGQSVLAHEGLVAPPTPHSLLPLLLGLLCAPLALTSPPGRRLLALAALAGAEAIGLWIAARAGLTAGYHSTKLLFVLTPVGAALAGAGLVRLAAGGRPLVRVLVPTGVAAAMLAVGPYRVAPPPPIQVIDANLAAAASWLRETSPRDARRAIGVGLPAGPASYWLQVGLLGQPRDKAQAAVQAFETTPPRPESWATDPQLPSVAIAPVVADPPPGATVEARFGSAAVLRRDEEPDFAATNPLTIRYRAFLEEGRVKVAIELLRPVAGRIPAIELLLLHDGSPLRGYTLEPNQERTRPQYIGLDLLPETLAAEGYVNRDAFPTFPAQDGPPTGELGLRLRLLLGPSVVDERPLAGFVRGEQGEVLGFAGQSGELIYVRHGSAAELTAGELGLEDGLRLTGWQAPHAGQPGEAVSVALRWEATEPIFRSIEAEVRLVSAAGAVVASDGGVPQAGFYPTWRWRPGESVVDTRTLDLPADLAPGVYRIVAGLRDPASAAASAGAVVAELRVMP